MQSARPFWVLVVVLALTAAGACSSGGQEGPPTAKYGGGLDGEVVRIQASFSPAGPQTGTSKEPPTVTEVAANAGARFRFEVVTAVVLPEDRPQVSQLFADGILREGASVSFTRFAKGDDDDSANDDFWVLVAVEDIEIRSSLKPDGITIPSDFAD